MWLTSGVCEFPAPVMSSQEEKLSTHTPLKEIGVHWAQGYYYGKPTIVTWQWLTMAPGREYLRDATSDSCGSE